MGNLCNRRRRAPTLEDCENNPNIVPLMNPEQEPHEWEIINLGNDEDQIWQIQSFDDSVSQSSSDDEPDQAAGRPPQIEILDYPNLKRGRLVMLGFRSSDDTMPSDIRPFSTS